MSNLKKKVYGISKVELGYGGYKWPETISTLWEDKEEARREMLLHADSMLSPLVYLCPVGYHSICLKRKDTDETVLTMNIFEIDEVVRYKK